MTLHEEAKQLAKDFKTSEAKLLAVLMMMREKNEFASLGYTGVFNYCLLELKLGEAQSSYFQRVAQKAQTVPALAAAVQTGELSLSQARRIVPVVDDKNADEWIEKAKVLPQRELERQVTQVNPKAVRERIKPVAPDRTELRVGISPALEKKIRHLQDLASQKLKRAATVEDVLELIVEEAIEKHDPVRKANRASSRKTKASVRHAVHQRDGAKCTHPGCEQRRWIDIHHIVPRSHGGKDTVDNLTTLCSAHHRLLHGGGAAAYAARLPVPRFTFAISSSP